MVNHTFVICAFEESPYLEECILSLKTQTVSSNIMIVTSTPNDHIFKLADKYKIEYYVNNGEKGITQDWNFAYRSANTRYVTIVHQDDIYEPEYLKEALPHLEDAEKPLMFFCDYYEIREGNKIFANQLLMIKKIMLMPLRIKRFQNYRWVRRRILSLGCPICCPSATFVSDNLPEVLFENHFRSCEDWEAWEKISRLKGSFVYVPRALIGHRIHEGSTTSAIIDQNLRSQEELEMYCKFWPRWVARLITRLYAKAQKSNELK